MLLAASGISLLRLPANEALRCSARNLLLGVDNGSDTDGGAAAAATPRPTDSAAAVTAAATPEPRALFAHPQSRRYHDEQVRERCAVRHLQIALAEP